MRVLETGNRLRYKIYPGAKIEDEVYKWCTSTFGRTEGYTVRWDYFGGWFYFIDEEDVSWFMLRWSDG